MALPIDNWFCPLNALIHAFQEVPRTSQLTLRAMRFAQGGGLSFETI